jgi:hypothetical protein
MAITYEPIATAAFTTGVDTLTFSSIPATYTDLRVVIHGTRTDGFTNFWVQFNQDYATGPNFYSMTNLRGTGSSAISQSTSTFGNNSINGLNFQTTAGVNAFSTFDIFSYASSSYKPVLVTSSGDANGSGGVVYTVGTWRNTAAINEIRCVASNGHNGVTATLYGIKAA